jgi:tetratricopeptide (TPR) repeat protein
MSKSRQIMCRTALIIALLCSSIFSAFSSAFAAAEASWPPQVTWSIPRLPQPPKIDGDLSEWTNIVPAFLGVEKDQIRYYSLRPWAGPLDSSARIWMAWDKNNLYFAADIRDDNFYQTCSPVDTGEIWSEDSLWLSMASPDEISQAGTVKRLNEFIWSTDKTGSLLFVSEHELKDKKVGALPAAVRKKSAGNGWICEGAIPWKEIALSARPGTLVRLSWGIADSDSGTKALISDIGAHIGTKDFVTADLIALLWPRSVGSFYKPWNFALVTLSGSPPPTDNSLAQQSAAREYQRLLARHRTAKDMTPAQALLWDGQVQTFFGKVTLATGSYHRVLSKFREEDSSILSLRCLARLLSATQGQAAAVEACKEIIKASAQSSTFLRTAIDELAKREFKAKGEAAASQELSSFVAGLQGSEVRAEAQDALANYSYRQGKLDLAEGEWTDLIKRCSKSAGREKELAESAQEMLLYVTYKKGIREGARGNVDAAIQIILQVAQDPNWSGSRVEAFLELGNCSEKLQRWDEALKYYRLALNSKPTLIMQEWAKFKAAVCLYKAKRYKDAEVAFDELLKENPTSYVAKESQRILGLCRKYANGKAQG